MFLGLKSYFEGDLNFTKYRIFLFYKKISVYFHLKINLYILNKNITLNFLLNLYP